MQDVTRRIENYNYLSVYLSVVIVYHHLAFAFIAIDPRWQNLVNSRILGHIGGMSTGIRTAQIFHLIGNCFSVFNGEMLVNDGHRRVETNRLYTNVFTIYVWIYASFFH